jgi:hypothetical protein
MRKKRAELTTEQVQTRSDAVISKIKIDFEKSATSYVKNDDMKYVVGRTRDRPVVRDEFAQKMLEDFNAAIVDVGGGRTAVVKR